MPCKLCSRDKVISLGKTPWSWCIHCGTLHKTEPDGRELWDAPATIILAYTNKIRANEAAEVKEE